ncbi:MAG TPA: hypothetical protein PLC26_02070 [Bacillota bacterium]|jgi:hypothetical protein|nr:hypothetical protein [Bacillota bacterium]HQD39302.1 hypothetical protein [Bacillota bacterium]
MIVISLRRLKRWLREVLPAIILFVVVLCFIWYVASLLFRW